ncbi:MAG: F0F1 ATP synthase subunit A [Planctomycetota bacterium]|jgi:F0F1-type ATP synthase membrane subunit a
MGQLLHPRVLAMVAVIAAAIFANIKFVPHHDNPDVFQQLFGHVLPEHLVADAGHGDHADDGHADDGHADDGHGDDEHGDGEHAEDGHAEGDHGDGAHAGSTHGHGGGAPLLTVPLGPLAAFDMTGDAEHPALVLTNLQLFQVASILLILIGFSGVPGYLRTGKGDIATRLFAGFVTWLRDEVVEPVMGRDTATRFLPYFLSVFFFILFMNLMGLLPWSATPTASIFVTGALAAMTLAIMVIGGMLAQGPVAFWKNLIPHVPAPLLVIMVPVELMGLIVKPVALMIRLFATMMGGHLVVLSFMGLAFVALLQAYIFTQLSVIFIQGSLHPAAPRALIL